MKTDFIKLIFFKHFRNLKVLSQTYLKLKYVLSTKIILAKGKIELAEVQIKAKERSSS